MITEAVIARRINMLVAAQVQAGLPPTHTIHDFWFTMNFIIDTQITTPQLLRPFMGSGWQNGNPMLRCEWKKLR